VLRRLKESVFSKFIPVKEHGIRNDPRPTGTKKSGLAKASEGPFRCDTCVWYENRVCDHPIVKKDPQLVSRRLKDGRIRVAPNECCFFHRKRR
jgi:hypothetical protein